MYAFTVLVLIGFVCHMASAFTSVYSTKWGERKGTLVTILLRDIFGIPVWGSGFALAAIVKSPLLYSPGIGAIGFGWFLVTAGAAVIVIALWTIRMRAAAPTARDALAESGIYARIRHPIHSGTILEFVGVLLIRPSAALALACALGLVWVLLQTRFEEWDLLQRIAGYRGYMDRVPRFFPLLRGKPDSPQNRKTD
jgi:protein-S-isoprenylcysteine O-methyltransferase Ste14